MHSRCSQCDFIGDFAHELMDHREKEGHTEDYNVRCPNCKWNVPSQDIGRHYEECVALKTFVKCLRCDDYQVGGFKSKVGKNESIDWDFLSRQSSQSTGVDSLL